MPKFQVCLTQDITQSVVVQIEAKDYNEAKASAILLDWDEVLDYNSDDDNCAKAYVSWVTNEAGEEILP